MTGDYRVFVGVFPVGDIVADIQALRLQHDAKTARITAPHVTLAGTYWRRGPATADNEAETVARLNAVLPQIRPFDLVMGGVESFLPGNPVIFLHIEPSPGLLAARQALLAALGPDKHGSRFTPHLTLAMRLDQEHAMRLLEELRRSAWHSGRWVLRITELGFMQRGPGDPGWRTIAHMSLA